MAFDYIIIDEFDGKYGVLDKQDGIIDYCTPNKLVKLVKQGFQIDGVSKDNNGYHFKVYRENNELLNYVRSARLAGKTTLSLSDIVVNTNTFQIKKVKQQIGIDESERDSKITNTKNKFTLGNFSPSVVAKFGTLVNNDTDILRLLCVIIHDELTKKFVPFEIANKVANYFFESFIPKNMLEDWYKLSKETDGDFDVNWSHNLLLNDPNLTIYNKDGSGYDINFYGIYENTSKTSISYLEDYINTGLDMLSGKLKIDKVLWYLIHEVNGGLLYLTYIPSKNIFNLDVYLVRKGFENKVGVSSTNALSFSFQTAEEAIIKLDSLKKQVNMNAILESVRSEWK